VNVHAEWADGRREPDPEVRRELRFGVTMFMTDETIGPVELAREVEARGLHSLYVPEHTHIPTSRRTPPPTGDAELAEEYKRTLDPFVALSMAAAVTERLVFGVGFGWNADEIEHHGVEMRRRRDIAREHVLAMQALWRDDVASFEGEFVHLSPSWSWPKPAQPGGPPVLIGGAPGPKLFAHVAEYADGWIPIGGAGVRAALDDLARACEARGRDPKTLRIVPFGTVPDAGKLEYYASIGIDEVVMRLAGGPRDRVLPRLDRLAELVG
jgi:alkanesulfonate monooxygenase SsuD/methylene tetrahydromethanopterin reductase-like flavin-dependent oxidoreductase (luciferase family)